MPNCRLKLSNGELTSASDHSVVDPAIGVEQFFPRPQTPRVIVD